MMGSAASPKKGPGGRPPLGAASMSPTERKRRSLARRLGAGGSVLHLELSPDETKALKTGMKKAGASVKRAYVAGLIIKHR
jgi:hypothetical protein